MLPAAIPDREDAPTIALRKRARSRPVPMVHGITAVLTVLEGRDLGRVHPLRSGDNVVGRARECDIRLEEGGVSRRHAQLAVDVRGKVDLLDLGSTNGTFLNGERVTSESLRVGDRIRIGLEAVLELGQVSDANGISLVLDHESALSTEHCHRHAGWSHEVVPRSVKLLAPDDSEEVAGYGRLLEIRRRRMGERHASVAELLEKMGLVLQTNGQLERASECLLQALEIHQSRQPPAPRATARLLGRLASCDLALGRPNAAAARLERAERLLCTTLATAAEIGGVRLLLSQVLWRLGRERKRSMELARLAREVLANGGTETQLLLHGAQAWLRSVSTETLQQDT